MKTWLVNVWILGAAVLGGGAVNGQVLFESDVEQGTLNTIFYDVNGYAQVIVDISSDVAHSGSKSIKIGYPINEAGVELKAAPFPPTRTLYTRKYEYYAPGWEGNWPVGLKTSRYFSTPNFALLGSLPGNYAYMSEKLIWQSYGSTCTETSVSGFNNAVGDLDLVGQYSPNTNFRNGSPYIRTGHWYKFETWMVYNSAVDVPDGVLKVWIDDILVYSNTAVMWKSTARGIPNGDGWQSMWFGGNYTGGTCAEPGQTVYRYIDDFYLSTTLDRDRRPFAPIMD